MWRANRPLALLLVAAFLVACAAAGLVPVRRCLDPSSGRPFGPAAWATAASTDRGQMARDAISNLPVGTPRIRVHDLLGEPGPFPGVPGSRVDGFGRPLEHPETWAYYLGCWSGLGQCGFAAPSCTSTSPRTAGWSRQRSQADSAHLPSTRPLLPHPARQDLTGREPLGRIPNTERTTHGVAQEDGCAMKGVQPTTVYVLYFMGPSAEGHWFGRFLGVYSSQARAARATERL